MTPRQNPPSRWPAWLRISVFKIDLALAIVVTVAGVWLFAYFGYGADTRAGIAFLQSIEQSSLDLRFGMRGQRPHDDRIVIVGIDERTLQEVGSFPLPRTAYPTLVDQRCAGRATGSAFGAT